ncbi:MAG: peptide chain release factor aRF-1 [Candidatus Micrarchaeota archaeon]|nr:peptide chain release factor aRF-1 [Candidatus Micrarchaeota archaeon]MDE1824539.1 peptide chain release factor aRF-1 [Candidatus Micrarchaeota archaeon]MDE1850085.1 peptide chain release factor aRF-1 [Candidatus Micrarchaeota archaeon]
MKKEYNMIKEIKRLKSIRGYGTELISVYVPAGFNISEEVSKLREEHSQSSNIKSKSVRTNVQSALEKILQYLKLYRETPKNGLAIFCGNTSKNPGKTEIELFAMEPPIPLKVNIYRCDSTFLLEPIEAIVEAKDVYVLVVLDGREATIATLRGSHVQVIKKLNSMVHAKVRKGGQSAARYSRGIEESIGEYHQRVANVINATFEQYQFKIKGLIVGGPGPTKDGFIKSKTLNYQIKVLGVYDTGYTEEFGLQELVEKAAELLKEQQAGQERRIIERFMQEIVRKELAIYGYEKTKKALESGQVATLIINEDISIHLVKYKCTTCNQVMERIEKDGHREEKHEDGGTMEIVEDKDAIEELIDIADKKGVETVFVSSESSYGKEFLMGFQGIGALLRYKM